MIATLPSDTFTIWGMFSPCFPHVFPMSFPLPIAPTAQGCRVRGHGTGLWETPLGHQSDAHLGVQGASSLGLKFFKRSRGKIWIFWGYVYLSVYLFICLFIYLFIYSFIYPFMYLYFFNDPLRIESGWRHESQKTPNAKTCGRLWSL